MKTPALSGIKRNPSEILASSELLGSPFVLVEIETTGYAPSFNNIIAISIAEPKNGKIKKTYKTLINPLRNVPYSVALLTGITNEELLEAPTFEEIADEIQQMLQDKILVSFNTPATLTHLLVEFKRIDRKLNFDDSLSIVEVTKKLFPESKNYSRKTSASLYSIALPEQKSWKDSIKISGSFFTAVMDKLHSTTKVRSIAGLKSFLQAKEKKKPGEKTGVLTKMIQDIPNHPGVYFFEGAYGKLLYIGKAKSLRARLKSYLSRSAARKSRKLADTAKAIRLQMTNTELTALLTEAELIKTLNPKHNVMLRDYGNKYFLRLKTDTPFPAPELTNQFLFDGHDYYGLFITRRKAAELKDLVDRAFLLRECDDKEFAKGKGCFLAEIDRCLAPCYKPDKVAYSDEMNKIEDFFSGKSSFVLERILKKMKVLSSDLKFEQAAELKRLADIILGQVSKASLLSEPLNRAKVILEITGPHGNDLILLINGKVFIHNAPGEHSYTFYSVLKDYYNGDYPLALTPDEEDLEKIRIILNWVIKNNTKVSIHYLKDYSALQQIEYRLSLSNSGNHPVILELPELLKHLQSGS